jgi:hypothetical protein
MKQFLKGRKTYIVATLLVLVSLVNFLAGDASIQEFLSDPNLIVLLNGLGLAAIRNGVGD